ncbi:MAG: adenylate/guanylate cyclase domain-containing protein [Desulfomonilaceae bacterium]|nr:adenylate/guanylate cyclase domain-containing protein [Desulfomonilaceae bacterium]
MLGKVHTPASKRLLIVPLINLSANMFGAAVTFVWFSVIEPKVTRTAPATSVWDALVFSVLLMVVVLLAVMPVFVGRVFRPILRESRVVTKDALPEMLDQAGKAKMLSLIGRIFDLPIKIAISSLICWLVMAFAIAVTPYVLPSLFPWALGNSLEIVAWMVFVGAPSTVVFAYFALDWWLRSTVYHSFPHAVLGSLPPSRRINVLPKILLVTFMVGSLPVALISWFIVHRIQDIQAGSQSLEGFISQMPVAIDFLLAWALVLAAGLSLFVSKSISEPLRYIRLAMERIGTGDLDTVVPVVSNDDIGHMGEQFNLMLKEIKELTAVRETFGRYLSEEVVAEILKSPGGVELRGELREITILVSDLRGFTPLSEQLPPHAVLEIINRYLERMTDIIMRHEGTIDEFTGDGILVFFGAPRVLPDHASRAVACAVDMQTALTSLNREYHELGLPRLQMGIGINTGELIVGNIGSEKRKKYGALGNPINVAFRVESHTTGGEILLTSSVYRCLDTNPPVCSTREVRLKGIDKPVTLYQMTAENERQGRSTGNASSDGHKD